MRLAGAAKVGRAMELPSPVASLIPSLVLKAVVTFGSRSAARGDPVQKSARFCAARAVAGSQNRSDPMARKRKQEARAN